MDACELHGPIGKFEPAIIPALAAALQGSVVEFLSEYLERDITHPQTPGYAHAGSHAGKGHCTGQLAHYRQLIHVPVANFFNKVAA
jgi:hypothetical protein